MTILEGIAEVAKLRRLTAEQYERKKDSQEKWRLDNQGLLADLDIKEEALSIAEGALRKMTIEAYRQTGEKQPAPGVGVRVTTRLRYELNKAFEWAQDHHIALKLDVGTFEKLAKAQPLPFVEMIEDAQATIAADLQKTYEEAPK